MNPKVPYGPRHKYAHLLPSDRSLWIRFITTYPDFFDDVIYDYHVGEGIPINPDWEPEIARMAKTITQRRIDVIGFKSGKTWIIELKQDPGVTVVGQLLAYRALYEKDNPDEKIHHLCLVCNRIDRDLDYVLKQHHIPYYIV